MVREQLLPRGIKDERIVNAFLKVERHKFIPQQMRGSAYADCAVPIGEGQTISQPYIVALMTELLSLSGKERVLEIGTGSGYQTAILAELSNEVYTIERCAQLAKRAELLLTDLGYRNIKMKIADGTLGWPEEKSLFTRIIITAAGFQIPPPLLEQLAENARLVLPLGGTFSQTLTLIQKQGKEIKKESICGCVFVPLIGEYSYPERDAL